jgi:uncharacterized protein (DUF1499 family)
MQKQDFATLIQTIVVSFLVCIVSLVGLTQPSLSAPLPSLPVAMVGQGLLSFPGSRPSNLGVIEGHLIPCPQSPNCVSSQSNDLNHAIAPLSYDTEPAVAFSNLKRVIQDLPRTKIVQAADNYLYVEFTSAFMGFVDDVEFYLDPEAKTIQVRSASRLGESDLGVNRQRIETLRSQLNALQAG